MKPDQPLHPRLRRRAWILAALLLALGAAQYLWNIVSLPPLVGYDSWGHAQYIATILDEGRLPHPLEGWSSFHPPFYYLLAGLLSRPTNPIWHPIAVQGISAFAMLAAAWASFWLVFGSTRGLVLAGSAMALVLFAPYAQFAAIMIGNEALGAGLATLGLAALLRLQSDPRRLGIAALAGLLVGLALATKYTGLFVAVACVVPFWRRDLDRQGLRSLLLLGAVAAAVSGPVYVRNLQLSGSPIPMTRDLEPMRSAEADRVIRERRLIDYLWIDPVIFQRPSIRQLAEGQDASVGLDLNPAMTNVWGLTYASIWYDAHAVRLAIQDLKRGIWAGPLLLGLGLAPSLAMTLGFGLALRELRRRRGRSSDAPAVVMASVGLLTFVGFTISAPSTAAVKASYLLPLLGPAALFFARGIGALPLPVQRLALTSSALAVAVAVGVFTNGLLFAPHAEALERAEARERSKSTALARVEAQLERAQPGRWESTQATLIEMGWAVDGWILWGISARDHPQVTERAATAWCGYLGELMAAHLPGQPWLAVVLQDGAERHQCDHRSWRPGRSGS